MKTETTKFPEILKDGDLELRRLKPTFELAKTMLQIIDKNREHLGRWLPWVEKTKTIEDAFGGLQAVYNGEWDWTIFLGDKLVGKISFVKMKEESKLLEIGYWLDKDANGRGLMTRSVRLIEDAAFATGQWNRIQIRCDANNEKSRNVPKRAGYVYEGTMRQDCLYGDGTFGDTMIFSKLKSDWSK